MLINKWFFKKTIESYGQQSQTKIKGGIRKNTYIQGIPFKLTKLRIVEKKRSALYIFYEVPNIIPDNFYIKHFLLN